MESAVEGRESIAGAGGFDSNPSFNPNPMGGGFDSKESALFAFGRSEVAL
jgi:hypothetical protein